MPRIALIFALLFLFAAPFSLFASSMSLQNHTVAEANLSISNTSAYLNTVNESSYLIFAPDLKQAYSYLDEANYLRNKSPDSAILYSNLATAAARNAYGDIESYRKVSVAGALVFTIIMGLILYRFMSSVKGSRRR
jgi:hypothetical protein